jgi:hypothetical protein
MPHPESIPRTESVVKLYEDVPVEGAIGKALAELNPRTNPWLEVGLHHLHTLAETWPHLFGPTFTKAQAAVDAGVAKRLAPLIERDLANTAFGLQLQMALGTWFTYERELAPESEEASLLTSTRSWIKEHMDLLGVKGALFPKVTLFTPPTIAATAPAETRSSATHRLVRHGGPTLEEGLALHWSERYRSEVLANMYPHGHRLYQALTADMLATHPELAGTRLFFEPRAEEYTTLVNDYSQGGLLVHQLMADIPNFLTLVEQARIDGKTLSLARAIEANYGAGSYRKLVTGVFSTTATETADATQQLSTGSVSGFVYGSCVMIEMPQLEPNEPSAVRELALYQLGMVAAEEMYHATAPVMIHVDTRSRGLNYRANRRGMAYVAKSL